MMSLLSSPTCHKKSGCISGFCGSKNSSRFAMRRLGILSAFCQGWESFGYTLKIMLAQRTKHSVPMSQSNFMSFLGRRYGKELAVRNYMSTSVLWRLLSVESHVLLITVFPTPCSNSVSHLCIRSSIKECKLLKDKSCPIIPLIISLECTVDSLNRPSSTFWKSGIKGKKILLLPFWNYLAKFSLPALHTDVYHMGTYHLK